MSCQTISVLINIQKLSVILYLTRDSIHKSSVAFYFCWPPQKQHAQSACFPLKTRLFWNSASHIAIIGPQKSLFWGGVCFSILKSWIFEFGSQKCFCLQKSLDRTFRPIFSQPSAISGHQTNFKISKISKIFVFEGKFCDFFFKNEMFV